MNKYIMMFVAAIALVSCSDDVLETPSTPVKAGAEVQFGLSLEGTRTVYGEEANNAFPIYWVDGDKVQIYSPDCLQGRNAAEYKVSVAKANQNYADSLTPTGDTGIQWGNDETKKANFYSFYPSGAYRLDPTDNTQITGVKISTLQTVEYRGKDTATGKDIIKSNMQDCLMYASAEGVDYGATVNLQYKPITTVLMLNLSVDTASDVETFNVSKITLTAPSGIVGTFNVDLETGKFVKFADNTGIKSVETNIIDSETGGFHTITKGENFEVPVFIAPDQNVKLEGWKIEILANNLTFTKTIKAGEITYGNGNTGLVAGKIHRITLPGFKVVNTDPGVTDEWLVANWMKNIPRNVYLSEVSIPGSWDTVNGERQSNTTIAGQYSSGVRAFHFDTRWRTDKTRPGFLEGIAGYISGNIDNLSVCDAASSYQFSGISGANRVVAGAAKTFETYLDEIVGKLNQEEYMVLICSFAHDSYDYEGTNGKWYDEISAICSKDKYASTIADARTITSNTVIGEVLGKLIVIVNMPNEINSTSILPSNSKCLFTCMPANLTSSYYTDTDTDTDTNSDTTISLNQKAFWVATTTADGASSSKQTDMIVYNNQTQRTASGNGTSAGDRGYAPSETERTTILNNILTWSKNNYNNDNYAHNMWIYMGLGGYLVNSNGESEKGDDTVASTFNTWINGKVTEMGTTPTGQTVKVPYYPVGIVLMNYVSDYASVVKNILLLNNKYQLQFDPNKPTKTEDYALQQADYDGSLTNGGNAIQ